MASKRVERAKAKGSLATELAITGAAVGSLAGPVGGIVGGSVGGLAGLIIADQTTVIPVDMIAIPAYQAYMITMTPALQIYIKAGETIVATGGNVQDLVEGQMEAEGIRIVESAKRKRAKGAGLPRKYAKMGFKKGWAAYKRTPAYKNKQARKKKAAKKRKR
jgi:hypothetical protein